MKYLLCRSSVWIAAALLTACAAVPENGGVRSRPAAVPPPPAQTVPRAPQPPLQPQPPFVPPPVQSPPPLEAPPVEPPPTPVLPPESAAPPQPPAVVALLDSAGRQEKTGKLEAAAATLERAVRVDPRNPLVWHRLARVRLAQEQWQAAANMAAKSNSLATGEVDLQRRNWNLIAEARQRMGDNAGARAARANAAR